MVKIIVAGLVLMALAGCAQEPMQPADPSVITSRAADDIAAHKAKALHPEQP